MIKKKHKNKCGNCGEYLAEDDKYCSFCGTRRGEGEYSEEIMKKGVCKIMYGPEVAVKHRCSKCGDSWIEHSFGTGWNYYCPKCGTELESETDVLW